MANQKKGFVMYFDSLGLLRLFPPAQTGELLLALYDYAQRICETEEEPEEAMFRYPLLEETTQIGFCSIAWHILRDTRVWKQRQAHCRQSALARQQRLQPAAPPPAEEPAQQREGRLPRPQFGEGILSQREVVDTLRAREMIRQAEKHPEEPLMDPERRRALIDEIRRSLAEPALPDETPIEEIM